MTRGTVKFFNTTKGFGFVAPDGGGADVFVHATVLEKEGIQINEGDKVEFETAEDRKTGKMAISQIQKA